MQQQWLQQIQASQDLTTLDDLRVNLLGKSGLVTQQRKTLGALAPEERKAKGLKGREWATSDEAGFTSEHQAKRVIESFDELFSTWKPREKFEFIKATDYPKRTLKHKLIY